LAIEHDLDTASKLNHRDLLVPLTEDAIRFCDLLQLELEKDSEALYVQWGMSEQVADAKTRCLRGNSYMLDREVKRVCKKLGIKATRKDLEIFLNK
jgi:hypothetical protein